MKDLFLTCVVYRPAGDPAAERIVVPLQLCLSSTRLAAQAAAVKLIPESYRDELAHCDVVADRFGSFAKKANELDHFTPNAVSAVCTDRAPVSIPIGEDPGDVDGEMEAELDRLRADRAEMLELRAKYDSLRTQVERMFDQVYPKQ